MRKSTTDGLAFRVFSDIPKETRVHLIWQNAGIKEYTQSPPDRVPDVGVFIFLDPVSCLKAIRAWRSSLETALRPAVVGLLEDRARDSHELRTLSDVFVDMYSIPWEGFSFLIERVKERLEELAVDWVIADASERLVAFMHSRGINEILSVKDLRSSKGYAWPLARAFLCSSEGEHEHNVLESLVNKGLLTKSPHKSLTACPRCEDARLNIRSFCQGCGSDNIETVSVIHHFSCGGVFPENQLGDDPRCAKCGRKIIHIGVDYEKPALLQRCVSCDQLSDHFPYEMVCLSCEQRFRPSDAIKVELPIYSLRVQSHSSLSQIIKKSSDPLLLECRSFDALVAAEEQLHARHGRGFCVLSITVNGINDSTHERVVLGILQKETRSSDIICKEASGKYMLLLRETREGDCTTMIERIRRKSAGAELDYEIIKAMNGHSKREVDPQDPSAVWTSSNMPPR